MTKQHYIIVDGNGYITGGGFGYAPTGSDVVIVDGTTPIESMVNKYDDGVNGYVDRPTLTYTETSGSVIIDVVPAGTNIKIHDSISKDLLSDTNTTIEETDLEISFNDSGTYYLEIEAPLPYAIFRKEVIV